MSDKKIRKPKNVGEAIQDALKEQKAKDEKKLTTSHMQYSIKLAKEPCQFVFSVLDSCIRGSHRI